MLLYMFFVKINLSNTQSCSSTPEPFPRACCSCPERPRHLTLKTKIKHNPFFIWWNTFLNFSGSEQHQRLLKIVGCVPSRASPSLCSAAGSGQIRRRGAHCCILPAPLTAQLVLLVCPGRHRKIQPTIAWWKQQKLFSHSSRTWEFTLKVSADVAFSEASLLSFQTTPSPAVLTSWILHGCPQFLL